MVDAATGDGIPGAELTFSRDNGAYSTTAVDGGAFRFVPPAAGTYRLVSIEAKDHAPFESEFGRSPVSFTSAPGKDVSGVVLRLARERRHPSRSRGGQQTAGEPDGADASEPAVARGALFGHVTDARTGAPVTAFAIALFRREGVAITPVRAASFVDPSGAYRIDGLAPGTYEATAMAAAYAWSSYAIVQVTDSPVEASFALRAGARITGTIVDDATRRPLAGATLELEGRRGDAPNLPVAPYSPEAETGADGRFALEHVPPDAISMSVHARGYVSRLVSLNDLPEEGDAPPMTIALTPRSSADARFELTGIGAILRAQADALQIQQVVPNAGAADAGLAPGDQIVAVDGARVTDLGFERAIGAIRGPEGTIVALRIRRLARELDVLVTRKLVRN